MNTFTASAQKRAQAIQSTARTTNGAKAYSTTGNDNLNLFGKSGEINYPNFIADFSKALAEDQHLALRNLLHTRDIRGGKGVRNTFQKGLVWLAKNHTQILTRSNLLSRTPEVGYWKDLFVLVEDKDVSLEVKKLVIRIIAEALSDKDKQQLVAKWLPLKGPVAAMLRGYLKLDAKGLRKLIVPLRAGTTERAMCENRWNEIVYSYVPSRCMFLNKNSFRKHDEERFNSFMDKAVKGEVKVNSSTLYPHEVTAPYMFATCCDRQHYYRNKNLSSVIDNVAEAQWKNLPNLLEGKTQGILPVVDLSGSMNSPASNKYSYSHIAISLAAYISERTEGPFKDLVTTFADKPAFVDLSKCTTLLSRLDTINSGRVGYSTNVEGVFNLILSHAISNKIPQEDMPEMLLFLSDTQSNFTSSDRTIYKLCQDKYRKAGYEAPKLIFWVLNATGISNVPVQMDSNGAALVSGFSPSVMNGILSNIEQYTPMNVMLETLNNSRYTLEFY